MKLKIQKKKNNIDRLMLYKIKIIIRQSKEDSLKYM